MKKIPPTTAAVSDGHRIEPEGMLISAILLALGKERGRKTGKRGRRARKEVADCTNWIQAPFLL